MSALEAHFGGPDRPAGRLRDLLAERVESVPTGGAIDWVTYYFRDRGLAEALARAGRRGVRVEVTLDGWPRTPHANDAVIAFLRKELGDGLRVVAHPMDATPCGKLVRPRLHEKLYCFSHPEPVAFIGSFNPSGDVPEEQPELLRAIGDQNRGHNLLVELRDTALHGRLVEHARGLHRQHHGPFDRFRSNANRSLYGAGVAVHFLPRVRRDPVIELLGRCGAHHHVRMAASHLSGPTSLRILRGMLRRGPRLESLAEATERRVPPHIETQLRAAGAVIRRFTHPEGLPMHAKFTLIDGEGERWSVFGSFNWTEPSRRFNREIAAISGDGELFDALAARWKVIQAQLGAGPGALTSGAP